INGGQGTGICVSARAYDERADELRNVCAEFISDPCGEPLREFLITSAYQQELHLQLLDRPDMSHVPDEATSPGGGRNNHPIIDEQGNLACVCDEGYVPCTGSEPPDRIECCPSADPMAGWDQNWPVYHREEIVDRFVCTEEPPDGGCAI